MTIFCLIMGFMLIAQGNIFGLFLIFVALINYDGKK